MLRLNIVLPVLLALCAVPDPGLRAQKITREGRALMGHLRALVGKDPDTVRSYLHGRVKAAGGTPTFEEYVNRGRRGKSLVCSFGKGSPPLVLVAHIDHLKLSPGANDDASGCAVLLRVCEQMGKMKKPLGRKVIVLFADGSKKGSLGVLEFLARRNGQELAGVLVVDLAGIGDRVLLGLRSRYDDNPILTLALAAARTIAPDRGPIPVDHLPASEDRAFARRGVPAACLSMFPGDQVSALQDYLKSRGRGEALAPPALARTQGNRDGLSGIDPAALESAFRAVRAAVAMAATADLLPHRVRRDLLRDRRRMSRLLLDEIKLEATTVEERVALVRDIGPRDILKLLIETLEKKGLMAWSGVAGILRVHIGSAELRRGLTEALQSNDPKVLAEKLADLYRQHQGALIWDEKALVVTLRS